MRTLVRSVLVRTSSTYVFMHTCRTVIPFFLLWGVRQVCQETAFSPLDGQQLCLDMSRLTPNYCGTVPVRF